MTSEDAGDRGVTGNTAVLVLAFAVVGATVVAGVTLAAPNPPSGETILDDAESKYESADSVVGEATVTVTNDTDSETTALSYAVTDDNESKVTVETDNGTVVVGTNGTVGWVHSERTGLTRVFDLEKLRNATANESAWNESSFAERWNGTESNGEDTPWNGSHWNASDHSNWGTNWTEENTTAERVGTERIDGTEAYVVEVEPEADRAEGTLTVWVATEDSVILKQQFETENATTTVRYTETSFDVSVADSTFDPPSVGSITPGTAVENFDTLQNATEIDLPELTDERYEFERGSTVVYGDSVVVVQQYTGPQNVSLVSTTAEELPGQAENATETTVAGVTVNVTETDRGVAVWWQDGDVRHGVIADAERDVVLELAAEVLESEQAVVVKG